MYSICIIINMWSPLHVNFIMDIYINKRHMIGEGVTPEIDET